MGDSIRTRLELTCDQFLAGVRSVDRAISTIQRSVLGFTATFAGLAAATAFVESQFGKVREALDLGGELADLSANTGQSIDDLVVLRQAFQNAGLGAEGVGTAVAMLQKALTGVNEAGEPTKAVFDQLGVSLQALRAMTATQQLMTLASAFAGLPDEAARSRAAMDLFGRSGRKMLALFADSKALENARVEVGELAGTMQKNAGKFDGVSDSLNTLHLKLTQLYAGLGAGLLADGKNPLERLTHFDFTETGRAIGGLAGQVVRFALSLTPLLPVLAGLGAKMTAASLNARLAKVEFSSIRVMLQALRYEATILKVQLQATGFSFSSLANAAKGAFVGVVAAAKSAVAAIGAVGIATTVATAGFAYLVSKAAEMEERSRRLRALGKERDDAFRGNVALLENVASMDEQRDAAKLLDEQLARVRQRMIDLAHEDISDPDAVRAEREQLEQWVAQIEWAKKMIDALTPAQMKARSEHRAAAAAVEEENKRLKELRENLGKAADEYARMKKEAAFDQLTPQQQKIELLSQVQKPSTGALDSAIATLDRNRRQGLYQDGDWQLTRLAKMLEVRKQLFDVEKKITTERQQQIEKAAEAAKEKAEKSAEAKRTRAEFERGFQLDVGKMLAKSQGDDKTAAAFDRLERYDAAFKEAIAAGFGVMEADSKARQRIRAQDAEKAKEDEEKKEAAKWSVFADSSRRVGLGGIAAGYRADPLVKASQDATRATHNLTHALRDVKQLLEKKPDRIVMPGVPVFRR